MMISLTALRVSSAGGGMDVADYFGTWHGFVVGCTDKRLLYVAVNKRDHAQ